MWIKMLLSFFIIYIKTGLDKDAELIYFGKRRFVKESFWWSLWTTSTDSLKRADSTEQFVLELSYISKVWRRFMVNVKIFSYYSLNLLKKYSAWILSTAFMVLLNLFVSLFTARKKDQYGKTWSWLNDDGIFILVEL